MCKMRIMKNNLYSFMQSKKSQNIMYFGIEKNINLSIVINSFLKMIFKK